MKPNWRNEVDPEVYQRAQAACPMGHNGETYAPCDPCLKKAILEAELPPPQWESKFLNFTEVRDTGKTKVWYVYNKDGSTLLGRVSWHGPWRRYCFFSFDSTLYDAACLADVAHFMQLRMNERKNK